jgi:predicted P-loop ATPase/GTPase
MKTLLGLILFLSVTFQITKPVPLAQLQAEQQLSMRMDAQQKEINRLQQFSMLLNQYHVPVDLRFISDAVSPQRIVCPNAQTIVVNISHTLNVSDADLLKNIAEKFQECNKPKSALEQAHKYSV